MDKLINGLLILIAFQLIGEGLVQLLQLNFPAPVIGMLLLFLCLLLFGLFNQQVVPSALEESANRLLPHLPLFLIPTCAGIIEFGALLQDEWLAILLALTLSTLATTLTTALLLKWLLGLRKP